MGPARRFLAVLTITATVTGLMPGAVRAAPGGAGSVVPSVVPELSETTRLADRRTVVSGDRMYQVGAADGSYPATGWHIRGEMGGFWTPPVKLLDGIWFAVDGQWLTATRFTNGAGYTRMAFPQGVERTDFAPDGTRAALIGLRFTGPARTVTLTVQAHSELLPAYPWGWTTPGAGDTNRPDTGAFDGRNLVFRDGGYAALVGSTRRPDGHRLGAGMRGPREPAVVCPEEDPAPPRCDDGPFGRGTGGELTYTVDVPANGHTVWFAVAGGDGGAGPAAADLATALRDPAKALRDKIASRRAVAAYTTVAIPCDPLLARSVAWSKQNLADSVQQARDLDVFASHEGRENPPPVGTVPRARWFGAGWPDYPWIFATDGEYTAFAAVAAGQFEPAMDHLRALRDISDLVNARSGKVVHEVTPDGQVYFGANDDAGNTDESAKFPSAVALLWRWSGDDRFRDEMYDFSVRAMRYVLALDADRDGWPEGLGNVERPGMAEEKLDVAVYTIRGLRDLADLAASRKDDATRQWATREADERARRFEREWWFPRGVSYADSYGTFQRHWTGVTPMETGLSTKDTATKALDQREKACYTGEFGLFHTGTGPTSAPAGNPGPVCDPVVSTVPAERSTFSLNTAVMAVAEGNYGRLDAQRRYTTGNARIQLDPAVWELPGAMPEIAPSPDFVANIDQGFLTRSSVLQAWGAYGVLWPVVRQYLGVDPDLGRGRLAIVPDSRTTVSARDIRLGRGSADVAVSRNGRTVRVAVDVRVRAEVALGAVLPPGVSTVDVRLDGRPVRHSTVDTNRGTEVRVATTKGRHVLEVRW
ncbi:hypothetical protein [Virgisporangium ochraceum]|uniref:hypothetical protein n=1 Tax=Virgisporangium ochraceum TaxID=65505 RepID=UPI001940A507|nr:hypothetical protein [Virgisporangium ochraceum]